MKSHRQQGAVLLLILLVLTLGSAYLFLGMNSGHQQLLLQERTSRTLAHAHDLLLGFAATYADAGSSGRGPGFLPCPDMDADGWSDPPCNTVSGRVSIGRLPWRNLAEEPLTDGWGELLWYAVSSNHREAPKVSALNSDTQDYPLFSIDAGAPLAAAVVLAPGPPLPGQLRPGNQASDYLEGGNDDSLALPFKVFRNLADTLVAGNDQVVALANDEVMKLAETRALKEARQLIGDYFAACGYFPYAAVFDPVATSQEAVWELGEGLLPLDMAAVADPDGSGASTADWGEACIVSSAPTVTPWLATEEWQRLIYYAAAEPWLLGGSGSCGNCLVVNGSGGVAGLVVTAGVDLGTGRPSSNPADYFEGENATVGDGHYEYRRRSSSFNDQVAVVNAP